MEGPYGNMYDFLPLEALYQLGFSHMSICTMPQSEVVSLPPVINNLILRHFKKHNLEIKAYFSDI